MTAVVDAEIVEPLTKPAARALDARIRKASDKLAGDVDALLDLLDRAGRGAIHKAFGVPSWAEWFDDAVQAARITPTDRAGRKALAAVMVGEGLTHRRIAAALDGAG